MGAAPGASTLRPAGTGRGLRELLELDHAFENDLIELYSDAVSYSARVGDHDSRVVFEGLLAEEKAHAREFADWMAELDAGAAA